MVESSPPALHNTFSVQHASYTPKQYKPCFGQSDTAISCEFSQNHTLLGGNVITKYLGSAHCLQQTRAALMGCWDPLVEAPEG